MRKYITNEIAVTSGLAHKWLGIESGESGRSGEAIAYLTWAKEELEDAKGGNLKAMIGQGGKRAKEMKTERKDRVVEEFKLVQSFLDDYTKENNTVSCSLREYCFQGMGYLFVFRLISSLSHHAKPSSHQYQVGEQL